MLFRSVSQSRYRGPRGLWAGSESAQIAKMKELYQKLPIKPEWLTLEQIEEYAEKMGGN